MPLPPLARAADDLFFSAFETVTEDREDHSFSGIFFALGCDSALPVNSLEIQSLWVRGDLGRTRVYAKAVEPRTRDAMPGKADSVERFGTYASSDATARRLLTREAWGTPIFDEEMQPSFNDLVELRLNEPIVLKNGERCEVYVHADDRGDRGLVYDDERDLLGRPKCDGFLQIYSGYAHLGQQPFDTAAPWYGEMPHTVSSLRKDRRFVGRVSYGVRWKLWLPERETHGRFPKEFRDVVHVMLLGLRDQRSALKNLHEDVLMHIFNKHVGWDWFGKSIEKREYPPLVETSGSNRVDAALKAIRELIAVPEDTTAESTVAMAATIVSRSEDLKWALHNSSMETRLRALVFISKTCYGKIRSSEAKRFGVRNIPKHLFAEYIPEALASDVDTVQNTANNICTYVRTAEHWGEFDEHAFPTEMIEHDNECDHEKNIKTLKVIALPSSLLDIFMTESRDTEYDDVDDPEWDSDGDWEEDEDEDVDTWLEDDEDDMEYISDE